MAVDDFRPNNSTSKMLDVKDDKLTSGGTIHSGHFMVSRVHDVNNDDDDEDEKEILSPFNDDPKGFDFLSASKEISKTYNFGGNVISQATVPIDASLTKLFECMSLAYSGKITSPRWKQFRGLHVSQKQRIRLNNLIWREWHMQYICQRSPKVCQFACPLSDDVHSKPEAVVLEGKYWKRRLDTVTAEYKKWRRYFKERIRNQQNINVHDTSRLNENELLERVKDVTFISHSSGNCYMSSTDLSLLHTDMMDMDFTNELFASLNQPFAFPNPRELSQLQLGCADLIQPGLIQLQPNLEEFMDIDTMQELLQNSRLANSFSSSFVTDNTPSIDVGQGNVNNNEMSLVDFLTTPSIETGVSTASHSFTTSTVQSGGSNNFNTVNNNFLIDGQQNITFHLAPDTGQFQLDPDTIVLSPTQNVNTGQQTYTIIPSSIYQNMCFGNTTVQKPAASSPSLTHELLAQMLQQHQHRPAQEGIANRRPAQQSSVPLQPSSSPIHQQQGPRQQLLFQQPSPSSMSPLLTQSLSQVQPQSQAAVRPSSQRKSPKSTKANLNQMTTEAGCASGVISGLAAKLNTNSNNKRKDVQFAVPVKPSVSTQRKNRVIAPAPSAPPPPAPIVPTPPAPVQTPSMQASYLAELLKNGTYPGALISVKKEPLQTQPVSFMKKEPLQTQPVSFMKKELVQTQPVSFIQSPIKTTTNHYQQIRPNFSTDVGQHLGQQSVLFIPSATSQMQTLLPTLTTKSPLEVSPTSLLGASANMVSKQKLKEVLMPNSRNIVPSIQSVPSIQPATSDMNVRYSPNSELEATSSMMSPVSLLPASPDSSPLLVKRSPSPSLLMDTIDPVSPYSMSPGAMGDPDSPGSSDSSFLKDPRKAAHLSAEQKRRCNLKTGFDMLQQLVPSLAQNPKVSKATMLQKTAEFCKKLKAERVQMQKEAAILKKEIEALNSAISVVQSQLPETGVPVTRQRKDQMREMLDEYVRVRTTENWKFWIFSVIMNTLYDSYCNTVSTSSIEDLCRTSLTWLDQSCSLVTLRPNVLNALRRLSTTTSILTEPHKVKEQALQAVSKLTKPNNNMMKK